MSRGRRAGAAILLLTAAWSGPQAPDDGREDGSQGQLFEPAGKYGLEIDGEAVPEARVYLSLGAGSALLLEAPQLVSPLRLQPRDKRLVRLR